MVSQEAKTPSTSQFSNHLNTEKENKVSILLVSVCEYNIKILWDKQQIHDCPTMRKTTESFGLEMTSKIIESNQAEYKKRAS